MISVSVVDTKEQPHSSWDLRFQLCCIDDVAVIGKRKRSGLAFNQHGLGIAEFAAPGGGITGMADGHFPCQGEEVRLPEDLGDQTHLGMNLDGLAGCRGNSCAFLSSVLKGEETKEGEAAGSLFRGVYGYYPALFAGTVERAIDL